MRIGIIPQQTQGVAILIADVLEIFLTKSVVFARVAEDPAELLARNFHHKGVLGSFARDTEPVEETKTHQYSQRYRRHHRPDDLKAVVMGKVIGLPLFRILVFIGE